VKRVTALCWRCPVIRPSTVTAAGMPAPCSGRNQDLVLHRQPKPRQFLTHRILELRRGRIGDSGNCGSQHRLCAAWDKNQGTVVQPPIPRCAWSPDRAFNRRPMMSGAWRNADSSAVGKRGASTPTSFVPEGCGTGCVRFQWISHVMMCRCIVMVENQSIQRREASWIFQKLQGPTTSTRPRVRRLRASTPNR